MPGPRPLSKWLPGLAHMGREDVQNTQADQMRRVRPLVNLDTQKGENDMAKKTTLINAMGANTGDVIKVDDNPEVTGIWRVGKRKKAGQDTFHCRAATEKQYKDFQKDHADK